MPVLPPLPAPPFSDRCYRCCDPAFLPPISRLSVGEWTRCEYRCPKCGHAWSSDLLAAALGACYSGGGA